MGRKRNGGAEHRKPEYAVDLERFYRWFSQEYPDVAVIAGAVSAEAGEGDGFDEDGARYGDPVIVSQGNLLAMSTLAATLVRTVVQADAEIGMPLMSDSVKLGLYGEEYFRNGTKEDRNGECTNEL